MENKAVIFDFDGVIADSDPFSKYAFGEALKMKGIELTDELYAKHFVGRRLHESLRLLLQPLGREDEIEDFALRKKSYDSTYVDHVEMYPGVAELIDSLRGKYRLAIATGSRRILIDTALKKFGLEGAFEVVTCAEDYQRGKPDPEVFVTTLKKLKLSPEEAVVIEDAPWGVAAARAAGMRCIAVTHTHGKAELKDADHIVESLLDVEL